MVFLNGLVSRSRKLTTSGYLKCTVAAEGQAPLLLFFLGLGLMYGGLSNLALAQPETPARACDIVVGMLEQDFGALVAAAAGVGAIIASAVGGFKMAWGLVVVAVGSFILREYIKLFGGPCE